MQFYKIKIAMYTQNMFDQSCIMICIKHSYQLKQVETTHFNDSTFKYQLYRKWYVKKTLMISICITWKLWKNLQRFISEAEKNKIQNAHAFNYSCDLRKMFYKKRF